MGQPIRKQIQEIHKDIIEEPSFRTLLIDGNSLLFMAMKDEKLNSDGEHIGGIFQTLLQIRMMLQKGEFEYVYFFADNTYSGYERYKIYPYYKSNRDKHYNEYNEEGLSDYMKAYNAKLRSMQNYLFNKNKPQKEKKPNKYEDFIDANFDRERDILMECFEELFIRIYMDDVVEGDDLIAYYCKNKKKNEKIFIMSGDMDICQLISPDICVYNLKLKKFITDKNFKEYFGYDYRNVVVKKIFCGDVSDNIGNIKGLSEKGFGEMMPEYKDKVITIEDVKNRAKELINERVENKKKPLAVHENIINGISNKEYNGDFYEINDKLINLKNPLMTKNAKETMDNMMYAPMDLDGRSFQNLYKIILDNKIEELMGDTKFASFFNIFKRIEENEKKRFEKINEK